MSAARSVLFWLHLATGVTAGALILLMAATGALLAFERQIVAAAEREQSRVVPAWTGRLDLDTLLAGVREARPEVEPTAVTLSADPGASLRVQMGREGLLYVDPFTGRLLGAGAIRWRAFFHGVTDLHRWLGFHGERRPSARVVTGAANAAFLGLAISGLFLWWPRRGAKAAWALRLSLRGKARDWNWHNAVGVWCAPLLIAITATGILISYPGLTGGTPPRRAASTSSAPAARLDAFIAAAVAQASRWRSITLRLPAKGASEVALILEESDALHPYPRSSLFLDASTAAVLRWDPFDGLTGSRALRAWVRPIHTGEAGGWIGQALAMVASLGAALLVWTGLALSWRRFFARYDGPPPRP